MKNLISLREFVLLRNNKEEVSRQDFIMCRDYANFLSRQPQLSDFVPCGEDGLPLKKPSEHLENRSLYYQELETYQQALDKVLFKGVVKTEDTYGTTKREFWHIGNLRIAHRLTFRSGKVELNSDFVKKHTSLESLTPYNLELTENAKNII